MVTSTDRQVRCADQCIVGTSLKRNSGNKFWSAQVYRRDDAGRKALNWHCPHQHFNREAGLRCARDYHDALHAR